MLTKSAIIEQSQACGFDEIGFTTAEAFESQREVLHQRGEEYKYLIKATDLINGADPKNTIPEAKSIIVLIDLLLKESFDPKMEAHFGRYYIDEDRIAQQELLQRTRDFVQFLRDDGMQAKVSHNIPHRAAASRAGMGSVGKNCIMYSAKPGSENSWLILTVIVVDRALESDVSRDEDMYDCPDWCRNTCIVSCPTQALKGPRKLDPRRCISNLTYNAREITPLELREPLGMWIYGCDRCQNVCPRNDAWFVKKKAVNKRVAAKTPDFELTKLLHMDEEYFVSKVWPHMFYIPPKNLWLWKMNVARAMGNTLDRKYVPELVRAFQENSDDRVQGMIAWSLGRLGGEAARDALDGFLSTSEGSVMAEVQQALEMF